MCTTCLNAKKLSLLPHYMFIVVCVTVTICIHDFVFVTDRWCVRCEVRTCYLQCWGLQIVPQGVICMPDTVEARVRYQISPCEICNAHSGSVTGFSPITSVIPWQYHSTNAPYPFIHLPPTLYNVSLPALQISSVIIIPPTLHTHSFTYHPHYIMFLSQYFSFPLSVSFHHRSIPIHSPTTHTI